jgi:hypothetical protein
MKIQEVETITDLCQWLSDNLPTARVTMDTYGDIVINTGLNLDMGGYLHATEREGESNERI